MQNEQITQTGKPLIVLTTDGACSGNPGRGGYAAIAQAAGDGAESVAQGGYRLTTNSRMELMAVIAGLRLLTKGGYRVVVLADAKYVTDPFNQGWLAKWQSNGWRKSNKKPVENQDLWKLLLTEIAKQAEVKFQWVEGHSGHPLNERADSLAQAQTERADLPEDEGYAGADRGPRLDTPYFAQKRPSAAF